MFADEYDKWFKTPLTNVHVELGKHGKTIPPMKRHDKYTFIYNHRLAGYKNFKTTIEMFDALYAKTKDFKVMFTCADTANQKTLEQLPYANIIRQSNHDKYIEELSKCHANVTNSSHETYCISIVESMQAKQLIIAPNAVTFPELLGINYKYLFNSPEQQLKLMYDAVTNNISNIEHQDLNESLQIDIYRRLIEKCAYPKRPLDTAKHADKIKQLFDGMKHVTSKQAFVLLGKHLNLSSQAYPILKVSLLLEDLGYTYNRNLMRYEK
jgi:glycosyltransferase involved in cell wall biosynthesis